MFVDSSWRCHRSHRSCQHPHTEREHRFDFAWGLSGVRHARPRLAERTASSSVLLFLGVVRGGARAHILVVESVTETVADSAADFHERHPATRNGLFCKVRTETLQRAAGAISLKNVSTVERRASRAMSYGFVATSDWHTRLTVDGVNQPYRFRQLRNLASLMPAFRHISAIRFSHPPGAGDLRFKNGPLLRHLHAVQSLHFDQYVLKKN